MLFFGWAFSLRKCPRPRLASHSLPPTPISLYPPPTQLHASLASASCRRPPSLLLFTIHTSSARAPSDPRATTATHRHNLPNPPLHNGSAQLILPARAVLCPYAGPLIDHQRASTLEQANSRPSPTVSDGSSSYSLKTLLLQCRADSRRAQGFSDFPAREESAHVRLDLDNNTSTFVCAVWLRDVGVQSRGYDPVRAAFYRCIVVHT